MNIETIAVKINGNPYFTANCFIVSKLPESDSVVVIDPGDEPKLILQHIGSRKVLAIICTHGHSDHLGGASFIAEATGAEIYMHELDVPWARELYEEVSRYLQGRISAEVPPAPKISHYLTEGQVLEFDGLALTVLHTPGHSAGSVCLYHEDEAVLFSGDTLFYSTCGRTDLPFGDPKSMHDTLARLATLPPDTTVYPGHESPTTIGDEIGRGLSEY
ncbi:MAG: MBL fold metallo-hydrolase [Coriobacteriia bacterium]|nr:MBL fold metallo-hydrolase [Coriobacteriia bacterium]MCL2749418.1 MBL fold metallo-hydrolase [Coriobacteriia bacterium]